MCKTSRVTRLGDSVCNVIAAFARGISICFVLEVRVVEVVEEIADPVALVDVFGYSERLATVLRREEMYALLACPITNVEPVTEFAEITLLICFNIVIVICYVGNLDQLFHFPLIWQTIVVIYIVASN